jgi:hypothetical protein
MFGSATAVITDMRLDDVVFQLPQRPELFARYCRRFARHMPQTAETTVEVLSKTAAPTAPSWLDRVQKSIQKSVVFDIRGVQNDGSWVTQGVANAATDFLSEAADFLPGEPILYSSRDGSLVAEFPFSGGTLTSVVSTEHIVLFASVGAEIFETKIDRRADTIREDFLRFAEPFITNLHGDLEATEQ